MRESITEFFKISSAFLQKSVHMPQEGPIKLWHFGQNQSLPLVVQPGQKGRDLPQWAAHHQDFIEKSLLTYGAVLFRDFNLEGVEALEKLIVTLYGDLMPYKDRASPRSLVQGNIYTATGFPPDRSIFLHNEGSFAFT